MLYLSGFTGEIFCGKGALTPEQSLMEFISTSASFHEVKKQSLHTLEWDLLKVIMHKKYAEELTFDT